MQKKSACIEVRYEVLVDKLKDELCKIICEQQEEAFLEVEDIEKKTNEEFKLDTRK